MGVVENNIGNHEEALNCFENAIRLKPDYAEAWSNKGVMFMDINDYEEAVICFKTAISFDSANSNYHHNLAHAYFNLKNFVNAWPEYDWRWQLQYMHSEKLMSNKPQWDGVKSDSTLFIWGEQGIGDQILFSSMLYELRLSFDKIIVSIDKKLLPIFKRSFPDFVFIDRKSSLDEANYDFQIPLGSIPKFLRTSINDFNSPIHPYLTVNQDITNTRINELKNTDRLICGVSWRSFNTQIGDKKSIPFTKLEPILNIPEINFVNLQYYPDNFKFSNNDSVIHNNIININNFDLYNDLENLAYLIQACDVVVTCSNSTAHLAGALNKTTLLLAPFSSGKFWYWNEHEGKSLWYPSIKVFYQAKDGSWDKAIESIVCHLETWK
jgi:tetratricopeptide (TPR) repeat protein